MENLYVFAVVPHAGTWIEILLLLSTSQFFQVVPHAGTWIEMIVQLRWELETLSFPTRERGLKYRKDKGA